VANITVLKLRRMRLASYIACMGENGSRSGNKQNDVRALSPEVYSASNRNEYQKHKNVSGE
jgi:hypothetical protein